MEYCSFVSGMLGNNCYIVESNGEAMVIDVPMQASAVIMDYLKKHNLVLKKIVLTHGHYDHVAEAGLLAEKTGALLLIHESEANCLSETSAHQSLFEYADASFFANFVPRKPDVLLKHGDIIELGNETFEVLHTPGHSPGGLCLVNHASKIVFAGDTLFCNSIGRTDLPGGSLRQLLTSIKENLLVLDNEYLVLTGHGEQTTIGNEKKMNGYLA